MEKNKASRLDGLPTEFYQKFWDVVEGDLMDMFRVFQQGRYPCFT